MEWKLKIPFHIVEGLEYLSPEKKAKEKKTLLSSLIANDSNNQHFTIADSQKWDEKRKRGLEMAIF